MFHSFFLSIAFFLFLEGKNKKGSKGMGEITLSILKWERGKRFFVHLGFVWGWHLDYCFQVDVWWENEDVVFLMVREEKQNKGSCLEVCLGLMGYGELRSYQISYGSFSLVIGCGCEQRRKKNGFLELGFSWKKNKDFGVRF